MTALSRRVVLSMGVVATALTRAPVEAARADVGPRLDQPINDLHAALEAAMRTGRAKSFAARFDALAPIIERVFDLGTVLRVSIGMRWSSFDQATQERLTAAFRRFTVATYVASFSKYDGEKFAVIPGTRLSGTDRIVRTEIVSDGAGAVRLDYVMRESGLAWRAVDVLIDGSISRVAVQRSDFRAILANGNAEALIRSLHRKVSDLSEGALSA
jgi:phospholipid transport system substrate-binding protein